jgi:hypothetical protein
LFDSRPQLSTGRIAPLRSLGSAGERELSDEYTLPLISERNSLPGNGRQMHHQAVAHTLPTQTTDPDLDLIIQIWDRLAVEFKQRLVETVREHISHRD